MSPTKKSVPASGAQTGSEADEEIIAPDRELHHSFLVFRIRMEVFDQFVGAYRTFIATD